jgi:hypothetical protein
MKTTQKTVLSIITRVISVRISNPTWVYRIFNTVVTLPKCLLTSVFQSSGWYIDGSANKITIYSAHEVT